MAGREYPAIAERITHAQQVIAEMHCSGYRDPAAMRRLFSRLTGVEVDESFWLMQPFYTDFGRNIRVGRNVFVNHACEFMDRGGITIGEDVLTRDVPAFTIVGRIPACAIRRIDAEAAEA